ncbi:putative ABC multidrug transporter, partial [Aureobasidium melanogenum]
MPFDSGQHDLFNFNHAEFDFNIRFEQLFLSIVPSVLFIVASSWRAVAQVRKPTLVKAPIFQSIKLAAIAVYLVIELTLLVLASLSKFQASSTFLAASVLKLLSALTMIALSLVDHNKSPRPSVLLGIYLSLTLLPDATQARTFFLSSNDAPEWTYSSVFCAALGLKVLILLLEAKKKSQWLAWDKKEHSPEETSGIFSLGVFAWLNKMFFDGYKGVFTTDDLYPLDSALNAKTLHNKFAAHLDYAKIKGDKYGLVKILIRTLLGPLLIPVIPRLALLAFTFCQPLFIEKMLDYLSSSELDANVGYGLIGASVLIYSGIAISTALYWYFYHRVRTMTRSVLVTEIYLRTTQARIDVSDENAAVTLMSTDMERIDLGFRSLHEVWASVIQAAIASWLLYSQLGIVFVAPIGIVLASFIVLVIFMKFAGDSQRAWMTGVQKRVGLTATVIGCMKNLKLSGLSGAVEKFIQKLRVEELASGARFRKLSIVAAFLGFLPFLLGPPLTFAFAQRTLNVSKTFTSLSYLTLLTNPLTQIFQAVPQVLSGLACLSRVQDYLECETREDFRRMIDRRLRSLEKSAEVSQTPVRYHESQCVIMFKDTKFGWETDKYVLYDINTQITKTALTMVVGPVGSGKSTFCKALLGEIPFCEGEVTLNTSAPHVGVCEQTAFLFNGSLRDNIIGFSPYDAQRYSEVIEATALSFDLDTLPQGDMTNIGSDGITLSGGQKQRVSLARALYLQTDLLVLDDVFSGLDADTEEKVFNRVFGPNGILRQRRTTVVLCTHSVSYLPLADYIIALGGNTIVEQGSFDKLMSSQGYVQQLRSWKPSPSKNSPKPAKAKHTQPEPKDSTLYKATSRASSLTTKSRAARQNGDATIYKHYLRSMGWVLATLGIFFAALWGFFTNFPTIWLTYWSDDVEKIHPVHTWAYYAGLYAFLQVSGLLSLLLLAIVIFVVSVQKVGATIHKDALQTLIRAPLSFFTGTDTGVVTNLFSQDLNLVDTELPNALLNFLFSAFSAIGQAAVMPTSSPYMAISYPFLAVLLYFVQKFYLRTARQLRLLDLEAKSPLYTHFLDTAKGISTLRAFGFMSEELDKNAHLVNDSQRPAYLLVMVQQWLNLVLDIVVMIMAAVLTTLAVRMHSGSGFTGASLVTLMSFGENLSGIVIFYTKLETSIGAIARLKTFNETVKPEDKDGEEIVPSLRWPDTGTICLNGVSASYSSAETSNDETDNLALKNVSLTINSGKKIAICGRTGSGKSSLIALFLKLLDPTSETAANISIDGLPLYKIDRSTLRQRLLAVPQEAVFLPDGTSFKENLDPLNVSTLPECQQALESVGLWDFILGKGGLTASMSAGTLSAGQRQLLSLARVLLRRRHRSQQGTDNGILLLDEISSSVDQATEKVMQQIIKTEFEKYTVVAVSHRLDMIMDFDEVVVMDKGCVVEIGKPRVLAEEVGTRFGELVRAGE